MNNPSLESYCNLLYEFLCFSKESRKYFADVSSFSVISGNFDLWSIRGHLTPFHNMLKNKSRIAPHMLVHVLTKFASDWAIFCLFMIYNIHSFIPLLYLITDLQVALTFELLIIRFM